MLSVYEIYIHLGTIVGLIYVNLHKFGTSELSNKGILMLTVSQFEEGN